MLIMSLLVLGIGFLKSIMNLLLDLLVLLNKFGFYLYHGRWFSPSMGAIILWSRSMPMGANG